MTVLEAVKTCGGRFNMADMLEVRKLLPGSREEQDLAINQARRALLVTGTGREGRHGVSKEQRAANLDGTIGYLSIRQD